MLTVQSFKMRALRTLSSTLRTPLTLPLSPTRLCRNYPKPASVAKGDRRSDDETLGAKPLISQLLAANP